MAPIEEAALPPLVALMCLPAGLPHPLLALAALPPLLAAAVVDVAGWPVLLR
jgi:hypothetical protein